MNEKRLLLVSNLYPPEVVGGAELVAYRQARLLARGGWDVTILGGTLTARENQAQELVVDSYQGIPVYRALINSSYDVNNFWNPTIAPYLQSLIAIYEPCWVHFHNVIGLGPNLIRFAKRAGSRVCVTLHGRWAVCFKDTMHRNDGTLCLDAEECGVCEQSARTEQGINLPVRLRRDYISWCLGHADRLTAPSRSIVNSYNKFGFDDNAFEVISNGIDLDCIQPIVRSGIAPIEFLFAGDIGEYKGIFILLEALEKLSQQSELQGRWKMTIAGGGHLEPAVQRKIARSGFRDTVDFVGRLSRENLLHALQRAHALVLPSIWCDNEPVILLEAIASGAALLATNIDENVELIEHGKTGLLFEAGNPSAFADAMAELVVHPERVEAFSRRNLARRQSLSERRTISRLVEIFKGMEGKAVSREYIVICGGRHIDPGTALAVNLISGKFIPGSSLRLIWYEWADSQAWIDASAFWWWDQDISIGDVSTAIRFGLPVLARVGRSAESVRAAVPNFNTYETGAHLLAWLIALLHGRLAEPNYFAPKGIVRLHNAIRPRSEFFLPVER